jgi:hypothetical protein
MVGKADFGHPAVETAASGRPQTGYSQMVSPGKTGLSSVPFKTRMGVTIKTWSREKRQETRFLLSLGDR